MLTIKTLERIKTGARITLFNGIYAIILGALYIGFFKFILRTNFKAIDVVWQIFDKYNPGISGLLVKMIIIKGLLIITLGIAMVYLSLFIIRRKDRAAWIVLFIIGLVFWPSLLALEILDKNYYAVALSFIGWLTFLIGMIIPIRYYMQRDYDEY